MSNQAQQAPPLPQQIVLGLNAWNCKSKISNANWETKLNEQVNVNNGDSIFVKASYIDTRGTASGNIDLNVDTEISLEYYFYWMHTFNACKGSELISQPTADGPTNLVQQVLVGRDIPSLYTQNAIINPAIPHAAFPTVPSVDGSWNSTNINDADALPYLVYQSTQNFVVPAIYGPIIPASQIPTGENLNYVIHYAGITTNWEYTGVPGASKNKLPPNWILDIDDYFIPGFNPNGLDVPALQPLYTNPGMPVTAFLLPADVSPTLPYVSYIITSLGTTLWEVIDPDIFTGKIPASSMEQGSLYTIDIDVGTLDWTYWGSPNNNPGQVFICSKPPPPLTTVEYTLNTAFFKTNANLYRPETGPAFGASPDDEFNCQVTIGNDGMWRDVIYTGSGAWCNGIDPAAAWVIPATTISATLNGTGCSDLNINNFGAVPGNSFPVSQCILGVKYQPSTTELGILDGSIPQFTWNQITTDYPATDTYSMISGLEYQVVAPDEGVVILNAPHLGVVSDVFTSIGNVGFPDAVYNEGSTSVGITVVTNTGESFVLFDIPSFNVTIRYSEVTGQYFWLPGSTFGSGTPDKFFDETTTSVTMNIPYNPAATNRKTLVFTAAIDAGQMTLSNVTEMTCITTISAGNLIRFYLEPTLQFTCTNIISPNQNTTARVLGIFYLNRAQFSGNGFTMGYCFGGGAQVGTVIKSMNAGSGSGLAVLAPSIYDGTVRTIVPATVKQDIRPVKKRWAMTLPKGSYDPNYLAELISRNMSRQKIKRVNNVQGGPFGTQSTANIPTDSVWNSVPVGTNEEWTAPTGLSANTFYDSKNPIAYAYPPGLDYNLPPDNFDDMPFLFTPQMLGTPLHTNSNTNDFIYASIPHKNANGLNNLPNSTYDITLVPLLNDVRSVSTTIPPSANTTDPYYSILPFYSQNNFVSSSNSGNSGIFPITFGATQTSLLYNNENNSLFSFNYLHSPILAFLTTASTELTEVTAHMYTTNKKSTNMNNTQFFTSLIDKKSGILLNKMQPASFWRQLGFNIEALTVDLDNKIGFQMTANEFQAKTTGGFCGSSNIFNQTFKTVGSADQPSVADTELLYLTATPNNSGRTLIDARVPPDGQGLTIGTTYTIFSPGVIRLSTLNPAQPYVYPNLSGLDWNRYCGFTPNTFNSPVGYSFVATATGFSDGYIEYNDGGDELISSPWHIDSDHPPPQVYETNSPTTVTTTQLQNSYFTVNNTNTLNASSIPTQRDAAGHYLLEITGYNSVYLDDNSKHEIKSVISSYYVSANSFVSQPFPDSYNFFNYGAPISLSNIKVRILDPYTMQEANIGPNSSVYLQINKILSDQAVQQVEN